MIKSITETINSYFYKGRLDKLVQSLRDEDCLNEVNLKEILQHRRKISLFYRIWLYLFVVPALIFFVYLIYTLLSYPSALLRQGALDLFIQFSGIAFVICIYIAMVGDGIQREWRYIRLMTFGEKTDGIVVSCTEYFQHPKVLCEYYFFNDIGHKLYSEMRVPVGFDDTFNFKTGEKIKIAYDPSDSENSMVVSSKMEMFNLKREN